MQCTAGIGGTTHLLKTVERNVYTSRIIGNQFDLHNVSKLECFKSRNEGSYVVTKCHVFSKLVCQRKRGGNDTVD